MTDGEAEPRLNRVQPFVGFVAGGLGGFAVARGIYTDAGLVGPAGLLFFLTLLVVVGEIEHYRKR